MRIFDVVIVGGGPAGSACAWKLRRQGADVAIVDKAAFPRDKVCGGWITPEVLDRLEITAADYARDRVLQPIAAFRTGTIGGETVETRYARTVSYGIRRREFDEYLLRRSGAQVYDGLPVATVERADQAWVLNGSIRGRVLVGAGGHFCPVAHTMGAASDTESPVVAQECEFVMDERQRSACQVRGDTPELYFCRDLRGYGWCFRKNDVLNIGLGRTDRHRLSEHVSEFVRSIASRIGFDVPAPRGHAYLLYGSSPRRIAGENWLLIGDAAGLAYPFSGEGILPAIESGLLAAELIAAKAVESYRDRLARRFDTTPGWITRLGARVPTRALHAAAPRLLKSQWFARNVVLDRWFLHSKIE
jgi:menaquinone-9 beta-reductase